MTKKCQRHFISYFIWENAVFWTNLCSSPCDPTSHLVPHFQLRSMGVSSPSTKWVYGGDTNDCNLESLIILHKTVIRTKTNASSQDHSSPLFSRFRLLKSPDIHRYYVIIYMNENHRSNVFRVHHNVNTRIRDLSLSSFLPIIIILNSTLHTFYRS